MRWIICWENVTIVYAAQSHYRMSRGSTITLFPPWHELPMVRVGLTELYRRTYTNTLIWKKLLIYLVRSPMQCGCAFFQPAVRERIVGGIESIPHSWSVVNFDILISARLLAGPGLSVFVYLPPVHRSVVSSRVDFHLYCTLSMQAVHWLPIDTFSQPLMWVRYSTRRVTSSPQCFYDDLKKTGGKSTPAIKTKYQFVVGAHYSSERNAYLTSHLRLVAQTIIMHPQYNTNTKVNDIALVELTQGVDLTDKTIGFICLPMATLRYPQFFPSDRADAVNRIRLLGKWKSLVVVSGCYRLGTNTWRSNGSS